MTDKAPAAPMEPPAAVSLRRVEEIIRAFRGVEASREELGAAAALEALVRLVEAGKREVHCTCHEAYKIRKLSDPDCQACSLCCDTAGELEQFTDDREAKL